MHHPLSALSASRVLRDIEQSTARCTQRTCASVPYRALYARFVEPAPPSLSSPPRYMYLIVV